MMSQDKNKIFSRQEVGVQNINNKKKIARSTQKRAMICWKTLSRFITTMTFINTNNLKKQV